MEYLVYRSPKLHVLLSDTSTTSAPGARPAPERADLAGGQVRATTRRPPASPGSLQHDVEAYVKVDSKGWKALAKTVRPLLEKILEDQVQEAGWFVSR